MGSQLRSPFTVVIIILVSCVYVSDTWNWGKETSYLSRLQSRQFSSKLNSRRLVDLTLPSYINKFVGTYQETGEDEDPLEELFDGVIGDDCKAHVREWFFRVNSSDTDWMSKENAWVLQLVDSWGKLPEGILRGHVTNFGDFNECLGVDVKDVEFHHKKNPNAGRSFQGRYCMTYLADHKTAWPAGGIKVPEGSNSAESNKKGLKVQGNIESKKAVSLPELEDFLTNTVGIMTPRPASATCMPSSCSTRDINRIFKNGLTIIYTDNNVTEANMTSMPWAFAPTCTEKKNGGLDAAAISVLVLISFLGALAVGSGVYDYWLSHSGNGRKRPTNLAFKYLMAFSLYTNTKKWLSTRKSADDFGCLHGIRTLTTAWVVLAHTYGVNMFVPAWNHYDAVHMADGNPLILVIMNGFFCVDTFFFMSGMLVCFNILKMLDKTKGKLNIPLLYLHRYLRITPTYAILIGIGSTLFTYMGNGPYWYIMEAQEQFCKDNWWTNLLYINNVFRTEQMCNGESWYLANDMQFYLLSPFIIYPIWKWEKIGLALSLGYFLASLAAFPLLINYHGTPPSTIVVRRMLNWQTMIFIRPYARVGVFLVGIWLGWLLYKTRGKKIKIPLIGVIAGWSLSTAAALYAIFAIIPWFDPNYEIPTVYGHFYAAISKPLWGFAIGWVIFACVKGYGGLVNGFLSWSAFMPLGRLTFCVYLVSYHFQQVYMFRSVQPPHYDNYFLVNLFFAHYFLSSIVGYFCTLIFESPFMIIQRLIFEGGGGKPAAKPKSEETSGELGTNAQRVGRVSTD